MQRTCAHTHTHTHIEREKERERIRERVGKIYVDRERMIEERLIEKD